MLAKDIMTRSPSCATTRATLESVAQLMRDANCGSIPIIDETTGKLLGVVTDRDLAVRGLADGEGAHTPVSKLMTLYPFTVGPDDDMAEIEKLMSERQVRRVPVVDAEGRCIGIIAQADLTRAAAKTVVSDKEVALVLEKISRPSGEAIPVSRPSKPVASADETTLPLRTLPPSD